MSIKKSIFTIFALFLATLTLARAHAFLDHADPRVGSTVHAPPAEVKIWFTEELEGTFSKIQVYNAAGAEIDRKNSHVDPAHADLMAVGLPKLAPGTYKVVWHAVAVDTHHTMGTFTFEVAP